MYRIIIKRDGTNKLTGRAMYRSLQSFYAFGANGHVQTGWWTVVNNQISQKAFGILSNKPYRAGCYINPAKVLRESGFIF